MRKLYKWIKVPEEYPYKKYKGKYALKHWYVYWKHYGDVIPDGYIIHHKDNNPSNNDISNLELLSKEEHDKHHSEERFKEYALLLCPNCGKLFTKKMRYIRKDIETNSSKVIACSRSCSHELLHKYPYSSSERIELANSQNVLKYIKQNKYVSVFKYNLEDDYDYGDFQRIILNENYQEDIQRGIENTEGRKSSIIEVPCKQCLELFVPTKKQQKYCSYNCHNNSRIKVDISYNQLVDDLLSGKSITTLSQQYNISDKGYVKKLKKNNLPYKKKDIENYRNSKRLLLLEDNKRI